MLILLVLLKRAAPAARRGRGGGDSHRQFAANFISLIASLFETHPPIRLVA